MGVPSKRRTPRSKHERASHFALTKISTSMCKNCGATLLPHRACPACGMYRGKQVTLVTKRVERAKRKAVKK